MMKNLSIICFILLIVFLSAVYLPMIYRAVFFKDVEKTHLFYSPVLKDFIYKERIVGPVPDAVREKAEDHHAGILYQTRKGEILSRMEFEKRLPFIFYKNMDIWGLLPIQLDGRTFDKAAMKSGRRVMELKSAHISGKFPETRVWPLLESNPGQARLVFPEDRFRMTDRRMEFINADVNRVDEDLTRTFTRALTDSGFVFPARSVNGRFTVLKSFDEGVFLVDHDYRVFHVKRVDGKPWVIQTPISPSIQPRQINISESKEKEYYGLLLDHQGRVHLVSYDNYRLIPLPLAGYHPSAMDLKLIFNPLYVTAVYSDEMTIHAVAMDRDFNLLARVSHIMSRATTTRVRQTYAALFPFVVQFQSPNSGFMSFAVSCSGFSGLIGIGLSLLIYGVWMRRRLRRIRIWPVLLIAVSGIYGLTAIRLAGLEQ